MNDNTQTSANTDAMDTERYRVARLSRDPRFDGEFFLGVTSTGIYCRPICPARPAAEKNVHYFQLASQAAAQGFRPCLRCRPESAPGSPAWLGTSTTVQRALSLIREGALNEQSLADLAARLGVGERYLRKLFERELGVSPQKVALNQRLLFAKQLLTETQLPITEIAYAAGFGSVRRFNSSFQEQLLLTPSQLRGNRKSVSADSPITLRLHYRPPYDWAGVINFFAHHQVPDVEEVSADNSSYRRNFICNGQPAWLQVRPEKNRHALQLQLQLPDHSQLQAITQNVRRMFDLDANPEVIAQHLGQTPGMQALLERSPGARSPGHWSFFEAALRAIIGQQVSTVAARSICGRLAKTCSEPDHIVFPSAQAIAELDDSHFPMPGRRRETLRDLCKEYSNRENELDLESLGARKGIGPWTIALVAIRGAGEPDIMPSGDLGLDRVWQTLSEEPLKQASQHFSPWRSYAANLLWRSHS